MSIGKSLARNRAGFCVELGGGRRFDYALAMPIFLECQRCTACCRWPGQVRLTDAETARLAAFKNLGEFDFIQQFTRLTNDRRGLALLDKADGECIFLENGNCAVQAVKPQQCRDFPNLWNFPGAEKFCRARPQTVDGEKYVQLVAQATKRSTQAVTEILARRKEIRAET